MSNKHLLDHEITSLHSETEFNLTEVLHDLKHYLPAQAPLKDFIHHNTLHAFQNMKFSEAIQFASKLFGYKVSLSLDEFRALYKKGTIKTEILEKVITDNKGKEVLGEWKTRILDKPYDTSVKPRIGALRNNWKTIYRINLDAQVHPKIFRILCSFLDQGISIWNFPIHEASFLASIREMEKNSYTSFFKTKRARQFLLNDNCTIESLLKMLVGDQNLYAQYLFDQQFAHQGWSGMVSTIEDNPETLLDKKNISLHDLIVLELLFEIDTLDAKFGETWGSLASQLKEKPEDLFAELYESELNEVITLFQEAYEWSYYDEVLAGLKAASVDEDKVSTKSFQAMFCMDDRECSLRRNIESLDPDCETFGTPGFFGVEFYFKPEGGKFVTKLCPAPVTPKHIIKEIADTNKQQKDAHFTKHSHSLLTGWLISQTLGFWSAFKLFINIFKPTMSPATASSFKHMHQHSQLTIENTNPDDKENQLQIGFSVNEMANRVEALLNSIGLINNFAPIVYMVGHGSSSVNNPHFSAYDCGACSGRPGSVNARVSCFMANHPEVRAILKTRGISIPDTTQFIGGLHDTTRDEIMFFDEDSLSPENKTRHQQNVKHITQALDINAKERSRRFESINTKLDAKAVHEKVKTRSVSLFEPRPELNHATNTLCVVGSRNLTKRLFLDRRAFMNSYDYRIDPEGKILANVMRPLGPVAGGINLEYFFSRVDNQKLGAGTKLPHNVMGLFGVANGIDGDLRPGLPSQMIEVHDPLRLLIIVEHYPNVVLNTIKSSDAMYEWFINEWVNLVAIDPVSKEFYAFRNGDFKPYTPFHQKTEKATNLTSIIETNSNNLPVYLIK